MEQAPYDFIDAYYQRRIANWQKYPDIHSYYSDRLKSVSGRRIVNIGCGPQFFNDLQHFGIWPDIYIGLDINADTFTFLKTSQHEELSRGRALVQARGTQVEFRVEDITNSVARFDHIDCVVSVSFLGIFTELPFKAAIGTIDGWLVPGGRLVNLSWCGNFLDKATQADRIKYGFNHHNNPGPIEIRRWSEEAGLTCISESLFDIPNKRAYGWDCIHASVFERSIS